MSEQPETAAASGDQPGGRGLKVHHLRPAPGAKKAKTRVGRGEGSKGKTAGRGTKGTRARKNVPGRFEGGQMPLHMRVPKLKGFTNPFRTEYQVVNLTKLVPLVGGPIGWSALAAVAWCAGIALVGYLWARRLFNRDPSAR